MDLSHFDISKIEKMNCLFCGCESLTNVDISTWDTSNITTMKELFDGCSSLVTIKMNNAVFNCNLFSDVFNNVPNNFTIYVKDEAAKNVILGIRSDANVIIEPLNS